MDSNKLKELIDLQFDLLSFRQAYDDLLPLTKEQADRVDKAFNKLYREYYAALKPLLEQKDAEAIPSFLHLKGCYNAGMRHEGRKFDSQEDHIAYLMLSADLILKHTYIKPNPDI